jgi:hypothetical protein
LSLFMVHLTLIMYNITYFIYGSQWDFPEAQRGMTSRVPGYKQGIFLIWQYLVGFGSV